MVEWKGEVSESSGQKARNLDGLEGFNVPNFFVVTSDEVKRLFSGKDDPRSILNNSLNQGIKREIKEAYEDVGMSSEVREASGKAKNLVGGQRNNQLVSIRVSNGSRERNTYKLNVGSSNFFESVREVVSSYMEEEGNTEFPPLLIQKMVEPEYTGVIENYGRQQLVESVKGLGISLEEGLTVPHTYLLDANQVKKIILADEQLEISRNPVRGENQRQKVKDDDKPFSREEIEKFSQKVSRKDLDLKFIYKRGSFHVVDAYSRDDEPSSLVISERGIRASTGRISGRVGNEVAFNDQTLPPEEYEKALIARKGGYTSRDGYRAREAGKPALFQFDGELRNGQKVDIGPEEVDITDNEVRERNKPDPDRKKEVNPFRDENSEKDAGEVVASEVLPIDPRVGRGVCINRNSNKGYVVTSRRTEAEDIPEEGYLVSYEDVFAFEGEKAVLDTRRLGERGLENAMKYLDAELKIVLMEEVDRPKIREALDFGFTVFGVEEGLRDEFAEVVAEEEKRFIMEKLRDL
jgi:hypothetical protein